MKKWLLLIGVFFITVWCSALLVPDPFSALVDGTLCFLLLMALFSISKRFIVGRRKAGGGNQEAQTFVEPDFRKGDVELRFENGVVCIYGTPKGLRRIAELCNWLVEDPNQGHIHLEDHRILTDQSEKGAIAIFAPAD